MRQFWGYVAILIAASGCGSSKPGKVEPTGGGSSGEGSSVGGGSADAAGYEAGAMGMGGDRSCSSGDINLPATQVSGTITVNGDVLTDPTSQGEGRLSLHGSDGIDYAYLGTTAAVGGAYTALVIPGSYDLYYDRQLRPGTAAPVNALTLIRSGIVVGESPLSLDIDVPVTIVSGTVKINGAPLNAQNIALFDLHGAGDSSARLGPTAADGSSYSVPVLPGKYDLTYGYGMGSGVPLNYSTVIQSGVVVGTAPVSLDIDVPVTTVSVTVTINGAPASAATGVPSLRTTTDRVQLENASPDGNSYSALVVPGGSYDLYWTAIAPEAGDLGNAAAKIKTGIVVGSAPLSLDVDIPATTVSGSVTLDGAPLPDSRGVRFSFSTSDGDWVSPIVSNGAYSSLVVPGTYDISFQNRDLASLPSSPITLKTGVVIGASPISLDLAIPKPSLVSGRITMNGAALGGSHQFEIQLEDSQKSRTSLVVDASGDVFSGLVYPGTYDVRFSTSHRGLELPNNSFGVIKTGVVVGSSPLSLDLDIPAATVSGTITINGVVRSDLASHLDSYLLFQNAAGSVVAPLGLSSDGSSYSKLVIPGSYQLYYDGRSDDPALPTNAKADLGCVIIP